MFFFHQKKNLLSSHSISEVRKALTAIRDEIAENKFDFLTLEEKKNTIIVASSLIYLVNNIDLVAKKNNICFLYGCDGDKPRAFIELCQFREITVAA